MQSVLMTDCDNAQQPFAPVKFKVSVKASNNVTVRSSNGKLVLLQGIEGNDTYV